jgi:hypothetical protein
MSQEAGPIQNMAAKGATFAQMPLKDEKPTTCPLPPAKPPRKIDDSGPGAKEDARKNPKTDAEKAAEDAAKDAKDRGALPRYFYTQKEFWGGTTLSYTMYKILALFPISGFLGLDHMYMRSAGTGFMKFIMNILTLGYWYFYDAIQTFKDEEDVMKFGVSMPLYGPSGIGAGSFATEDEPATDANGSATAFLLFCASAIFLPFGVEYLFAGDIVGFVCKFVGTLFFIGLIYGLINNIKLITHPERVMCEGLPRYPPFTWWPIETDEMYLETSFRNKLTDNCPPAEGAVGGWLSGILGNLIMKVPGLREIYGTVMGAKELAKQTVKTTVGALKKGADVVTEAAGAVQQIGQLKAQAEAVTASSAAAAAVPAAANNNPKPPTVSQGGGGTSASTSNTILTFTLAIVFVGAALLKGKDAISAVANRREERPGALGNYVIRNKNASGFPPLPPESGVF